MKLSTKLLSVFLLGIFLLTTVNGYLSWRHEHDVFQEKTIQQASLIGSKLQERIEAMWKQDGREAAQEMIRKESEEHHGMRIRWVWLDVPPTDPDYPEVDLTIVQAVMVRDAPVQPVHDPDGDPLLHAYWPVTVSEDRVGGLEMSRSTVGLDSERRYVLFGTLLLMGSMILVAGVATSVAGVRFVGQPLSQLTAKTKRIAEGDLDGPVEIKTQDELGELAGSINDMCVRLLEAQEKVQKESSARMAAMEQLRHADRLQTVGRLASGVAHQLGTPLNVVSGRAELIGSGKLSSEEVSESAAAIKSQTEQMTVIIRQLLDFARRSSPQHSTADLKQVVRQAFDMLSELAKKRKIDLSFTASDEPLLANIDVGQIQQVVVNLLVNAGQAMPEGGKISISIDHEQATPPKGSEAKPGDYFRINVHDEGQGIASENLCRVFEPFFTTKGIGEGTGLGLSIAYGMVQEHGGWIEVASELGVGTTFSVFLPKEAAA